MSTKLKAKLDDLIEDMDSAVKLARKENRDDLADQLVEAKDLLDEISEEIDEPEEDNDRPDSE